MSHHIGYLYCGEPVDEHRRLARLAAEKAVLLDPENANALIVLGFVRAYQGELATGVADLKRGLGINPNHSEGWILLADLRVHEGRPAKSIECALEGFRLNPLPLGGYYWVLGFGQYAAGQYQEAVETLRHELAHAPGARRILAAALAQLGRMTEAREEVRKFLLEFPHFSSGEWGRMQPFLNDADRQHFIEGYMKAGLPV